MRRKCEEFVLGTVKRQARDLCDVQSCPLAELGMGVQPRSYCSTANGKLVDAGKCRIDRLQTEINLRHPTADFLAESNGCGVLQMSTTGLDDIAVLLCFGRESVTQATH